MDQAHVLFNDVEAGSSRAWAPDASGCFSTSFKAALKQGLGARGCVSTSFKDTLKQGLVADPSFYMFQLLCG